MTIPIYQIDAFADGAFAGNPAAVCLMDQPASDQWLQNVAMEMNLSETAFVWKQDTGFLLRWMTPEIEVDLCGHATLAATWALKEASWISDTDKVIYDSRSGPLEASIHNDVVELNFPTRTPQQQPAIPELLEALGIADFVWFGKNEYDYFVQVTDEATVRGCRPDLQRLGEFDVRGIIVTSVADPDCDYDFVSRFFAPGCGVPEDPVTGSAHVALSPFWAERMKNNCLTGFQASQRGGLVMTELIDDRVKLTGKAVTVFRGDLQIECT